MELNKKRIARYLLLPEFMPRVQELMSSGFVYVAFFMAQIYGATGLLPANHPYLNPENRHKFGLRDVIGEAARNLRWQRQHIDQIAIFFLILVGLVILFLQFAILAFAIIVSAAHAAMPTNFTEFFVTPGYNGGQDPLYDIAFILMDRVFGVENLFNSCVSREVACIMDLSSTGGGGALDRVLNPDAVAEGNFPWPYHNALHSLLQFYSFGLLVIATLIFLYFVFAVAAETAQAGTPFGRRFNHVWAPLRLVAAFGLLIPITNGLNSAQYIVLYAAKYGSGFATNGWGIFLDQATASGTQSGNPQNLIATPSPPLFDNLLEFATVVQTCTLAYYQLDIRYPKKPPEQTTPTDPPRVQIEPYLIRDTRASPAFLWVTPGTTFEDAYNFYAGQKIIIRFGDRRRYNGEELYQGELGYVKPYCGELSMNLGNITEPGDGIWQIYDGYWELLKDVFGVTGGALGSPILGIAQSTVDRYVLNNAGAPMPDSTQIQLLKETYKARLSQIVQNGANALRNGPNAYDWDMNIKPLGWAGAALWYNEIAKVNGSLVSAANNLPRSRQYPLVQQEIMKKQAEENQANTDRSAMKAVASDGEEMESDNPEEEAMRRGLAEAYNIWDDYYEEATPNAFKNAIAQILGLEGLFNLRENTDVHPLAKLSAIGKSLVESSINGFGLSVASIFGGLLGAPGSMMETFSKIFWQIGMMGLGLGFSLYYIIPFLPFIYFFFAVGGWIKGVFEAMVGVPLWALAHIRIDGNGLPGDAAMGGYYLILEIFLRPILIVFGLLASITIFSAQVDVLNDIWDLVTSNVAGFNDEDAATLAGAGADDQQGGWNWRRDIIDQFFFTVLYAIVVYMLALASFKLINLIPNHLLRWMGTSINSFGDSNPDAAQNLIRNSMMGTNMVGNQLGGVRGGISKMVERGGGGGEAA